ncbi:MAG: pilin [Patescibacteria group bacterium]
MKIKYFFTILVLLTLISLLMPSFVLAQSASGGTGDSTEASGQTGGSESTGIQNPLGGINDPRDIIGNVIKAILGLVGSLALGVFILGGVYWVTSAGSEEKIKKGKDMVLWASFGLAIIFASYALVTFVIKALTGT